MQTDVSIRAPRKRPQRARGRSWAHAWHDTNLRAWIYQAVVIIAVIALGAFLIGNAQRALSEQGISTGFGFLSANAGFEIGEKLIAFSSSDSFLRAYGVALLNTLKVSIASIVLATIIGVFAGLGRLSQNWLLQRISTLYVEVFRNTPQLVQLIFWYVVITRLPAPRQAVSINDMAFLSNRGLSIPWWSHDVAPWVLLLAGIAAMLILWQGLKLAYERRKRSGRKQPVAYAAACAVALLPILYVVAFGPSSKPHACAEGVQLPRWNDGLA